MALSTIVQHEFAVAIRNQPVRPIEMAGMKALGARIVDGRINLEHQFGRVSPTCALCLGVKEPEIDGEMSPIIVC